MRNLSYMNKDEKILKFSMLLLSQLESPFKKKPNINQLATQAGVSRAWVYKYFGATRDEMVLTAIDCFAPVITELGNPLRDIKTKRDWAQHFLRSIDKTLQEAEQYPEMFRFYFSCHLEPNPYMERLHLHEGLFLENRVIPDLKRVFGLTYTEARNFAEMLMATRMGMVLKWLHEPNKTPLARQKLVNAVRLHVFNQ